MLDHEEKDIKRLNWYGCSASLIMTMAGQCWRNMTAGYDKEVVGGILLAAFCVFTICLGMKIALYGEQIWHHMRKKENPHA